MIGLGEGHVNTVYSGGQLVRKIESRAMDRPRILYLAIGTAKNRARADAVIETWARDLPPRDVLVFAADDALARALGDGRVWPCIRSDGPDDHYIRLPFKMLEAYRRARAEPDWDFIFKIDDDTYAVPRRVSAVLGELDPRAVVYGGGAGSAVSTDQLPQSHAVRSARGERPFEFIDFLGGAGYFLSRPALEAAWRYLEDELSMEGPEDGLVAAAMYRAGIQATWLPPFFEHQRRLELVVHGCHATVHHLQPDDLRFLHRILPDYDDAPFAVAAAKTAWGAVGRGGWLGYEDKRVALDGRAHRRAISAHAPSDVLLRAAPGVEVDLAGALNDSAAPESRARFTVHDRQGRALLADLGSAGRGRPTPLARVAFPEDGRLLLHAATEVEARCHTLWLYAPSER